MFEHHKNVLSLISILFLRKLRLTVEPFSRLHSSYMVQPGIFFFFFISTTYQGFPDSSVGKESVCNAGDSGWISGLGRSPGEEIGYPLQYSWASLVVQLVKNLPAMWEIWVRILGWESPLEKGKTTHSSILTWRIPGKIWSIGLQRVRHDWVTFTSLYFTTHPRNQDWFEKRQKYFKDN